MINSIQQFYEAIQTRDIPKTEIHNETLLSQIKGAISNGHVTEIRRVEGVFFIKTNNCPATWPGLPQSSTTGSSWRF